MKHRRPSRDNRGGAACILATYAVAAGALAVVYAAVNPLPATQIRDLVSPPAASASVPTRPLSVLPGMGAGLELVRIPRGLDVHTVPWPGSRALKPHLNVAHDFRKGGARSEGGSAGHHFEGTGHVGRHRSQVRNVQAHHDLFEWGTHRGHDHGTGPAGGMGSAHCHTQPGWRHMDGVAHHVPHRRAAGDNGHYGDGGRHHRADGDNGHHGASGRHHRADGNVGEHHQGSHSQGGHHAEHEGGQHRG